MDSTRTPSRTAVEAESEPALPDSALVVEPRTAARLGRLLPLVRGTVRTAHRVAAVSAASAVVAWVAVFLPSLRADVVSPGVAALGALLLLAPAALTWFGAWTLSDLLELPARLRQTAVEAAGRARGEWVIKRRGLVGAVRAIWAARGLVVESRDGWLKVAALARLARLGSLPFALAVIGAFLLNGVVILFGLLALVVLAL